MSYVKSLWSYVVFWWRMRAKRVCDSCEDGFTLGELNACSGDAWLCDKCLHEYLREDYEQGFK